MTNQERNIRLAELLGYEVDVDFSTASEHYTMENENGVFPLTSWAENWSELMPLVVEYRVTLRTCVDMTTWFASRVPTVDDMKDEHSMRCDADPRIALVDCLISVLESKTP